MSSWYPQLTKLRDQGWRVAVHNDYNDVTKDGTVRLQTFWVLTHPSGVFVKGEGPTDETAVLECVRKARELEAKLKELEQTP